MNKLDLNISKYSTDELKEILDLRPTDINNLSEHMFQLKTSVNGDDSLTPKEKTDISSFLMQAEGKLGESVINLQSIDNSHFIAPDKTLSGNTMVTNTDAGHPIIEDPNVIGGKNAVIYEGQSISRIDYPPGYINPINVKTIKKNH